MKLLLVLIGGIVGATVLALTLGGLAAPSSALAATCGQFASQADAQAYYRANPITGANLDRNHDGIACSDNPAPKDLVPVVQGTAAPTAAATTAPATTTKPSVTSAGVPKTGGPPTNDAGGLNALLVIGTGLLLAGVALGSGAVALRKAHSQG